MINGNIEAINSPIRKIEAKVELLDSSTLIDNKKLSNIKVEKTSQEGKFFGFGVSQMAKVEILDANRELTASSFKISFDGVTSLPIFYTSETERNENTNILTITGYDLLSKATKHTFAEISLEAPFNLEDVAIACANFLGASGVIQEVEEFYIDYSMEEANLEGTETLREVLDDIAEVTGTFYFVNAANELVFKRLEAAAASVDYEITKARYFTLDSGERKELQNIVSTTELGDNISGSILASTSGVSVEVNDAVPGQEVKIQLGAADLVKPFNRDYSYTRYGVTKTIKNGSTHIWVNGTAEAGSGRNDLRNYADKFILEAGKTYILEIKVLNSETHDRLDAYITKNNSSYTEVIGCSCLVGRREFVMDETIECFIGINTVTGNTYNNLEVSITVREKRTDFTGVVVSVSDTEYPADPDGKVNGVISSASMVFTTNDEAVEMYIEYPIENVVDSGVEYLRDNAFLDLREDRASIVNDLLTATKGLAINEFDCTWRGNYLLELGDKIAIETKDGNYITTYFLDDTLTYNGALKQVSKWKYGSKEETASNPSTLGDKLKQTFAKVDKVNKQIDLVVTETNESIANIQLTTKAITASVQEDIADMSKKVEAAVSSDDVAILIQKELVDGVDKVTTTTGFTFNDEGLKVSKTGSEMTTQITEDGMTVSRDDNEVLTADNTGVKAENLHATTYLIVGVNSRFENYDNGSRTGCFWIGG